MNFELNKDFVHLNIHSEYSLLDGSLKIKKLVKALAQQGYQAAALTDTDAMHGCIEFYLACLAENIKPIIGSIISIESLVDPTSSSVFTLTFLAKDEEGYQNLSKLSTLANTGGKNAKFKDSTNITLSELKAHSTGLICLVSFLKSEVSYHLLAGQETLAQEVLIALKKVFPVEDLYLELCKNGFPQEERLKEGFLSLAKSCEVPYVATGQAFYVKKKDKENHLNLLAIKHKLKKDDVASFPENIHMHLKGYEEMEEDFKEHKEALTRSLQIAQQCNLKLNLKKIFMPNYSEKEGESANECLRRLSYEGLIQKKPQLQGWLKERFTPEVWAQYEAHLEYEISVIEKMEFAGYFLIVQDFINWAKKKGIPVGPGRGSAAGSLVTYTLGITNIDPLRFNLLFERFLNPERISMPDIDTDFCQEGREEVLQYVAQKYGKRSVCQIITFGRMMAKNALKNIARIQKWSFTESNELAKLIPATIGISLEDAVKENPVLAERIKKEERTKNLWEHATEIEGTLNALGVHAAGVVISDRALDEICPLIESEGQLLCQYEHKYAEKVGLIKFDFLGLKTLTVIHKALKNIKSFHNLDINIDDIELEDPNVYKLISTAHVTGLFQLESLGMRKLIAQLKPSCFNDIIAVLALFRPGPLGSGMVEDFVLRKHGKNPVNYIFPEIKDILQDTYGVIVYQEQVQKIASVLASYSLGEADLLRRAMGKKDMKEMEKQKSRFVEGAKNNSHCEQKAGELFDLMAKFAEYGFNKSHTTAYGLLTYQTGWLKTYYPTEFLAAIMTCDLDNTDKIELYYKDCRRMGIEVLPPCINESFYEFKVVGKNKIRYGLGAIKGAGQGIIEVITKERLQNGPYHTLPEFMARVDARKLNKKIIESLIKAGAFDELATNRAELMANMDNWLRILSKELEKEEHTGFGLFGLFEEGTQSKPRAPLKEHPF
jgi:DNA polymerase-3 subunit alpha